MMLGQGHAKKHPEQRTSEDNAMQLIAAALMIHLLTVAATTMRTRDREFRPDPLSHAGRGKRRTDEVLAPMRAPVDALSVTSTGVPVRSAAHAPAWPCRRRSRRLGRRNASTAPRWRC